MQHNLSSIYTFIYYYPQVVVVINMVDTLNATAQYLEEGQINSSSDAKAFQACLDAALTRDGGLVWAGAIEDVPEVSYTVEGEVETQRLPWMSASEVAALINSGEATDIEISPSDQGRLYAAVLRSIEHLETDESTRDYSAKTGFVREAVAGLYLLGKLDSESTYGLLSALVSTRPDLRETLERKVESYGRSLKF